MNVMKSTMAALAALSMAGCVTCPHPDSDGWEDVFSKDLSNAECADAIRDFMHLGLENIFLCHLSEHNNTPKKALDACSPAVEGTGIRLLALPRQSASPMFIL